MARGRAVLVVGCLLGVPCVAFAQDGAIAGRVSDGTGGVLPGASVEVAGADAPMRPQVAVTDGDGRYAFPALPPGSYIVTFTLPGFERAERDVELAAGFTATVDVTLNVGGLFEEVTVSVTGTAIEAPAINMPHAVIVVSRDTLEQQGTTQLVDLFRNLSVSHGVVGERSSWYNSNQPMTVSETVANVNLRGLGPSRTLVLINGRRHVPVPARLIGGRFVDVNTIPSIAVGRLEVLKEGAAATYGSDAVGGVAIWGGRTSSLAATSAASSSMSPTTTSTARVIRPSRASGAAASDRPAPSSPRNGSAAKNCRWRSARGPWTD